MHDFSRPKANTAVQVFTSGLVKHPINGQLTEFDSSERGTFTSSLIEAIVF